MPSQDNIVTKRPSGVRHLCLCAMLLGVALLLSYLEHLLPWELLLPLPGIRPGWAQLAVTVTYFFVGRRSAALLSATRVVIMALLFGSAMSFCFAACGAVLAFVGLLVGERLHRRCSYLGLGVLCATLHNVGQALAASVFFGATVILSYLPVLLLGGVLTGALGGVLLNLCAARLARLLTGGAKS
ncbi:MAG: Gx transporter family protein [Clostridia bacterium]|nr:Gx transporter family protein [Clostridia bacterium]